MPPPSAPFHYPAESRSPPTSSLATDVKVISKCGIKWPPLEKKDKLRPRKSLLRYIMRNPLRAENQSICFWGCFVYGCNKAGVVPSR